MHKKIFTISFLALLLIAFSDKAIFAQSNDDFNQLSQVTQLPVRQRIPALQEMLKKYPDWIVARYALGVAYYSLKEYELVIPNFTKVLDSGQKVENVNISEYLAVAHNEVAKNHIVAKRYEEAIPHLKTAIKLSSANASFYTNLGICYYNTGEYNLAKSVTQRAIQLAENSPVEQGRGYYYLGHIYNALGNFEVALNSYKRATELNPKLTNVQKYIQRIETEQEIARLFDKAEMYINSGNAKDAIALLQQVIGYDPNHLEAKRLMADAQAQVRRESDAKANFDNPPVKQLPAGKNSRAAEQRTPSKPIEKKPEIIVQEQIPPKDTRSEDAARFYEQGKFKEAQKLFLILLNEDPSDRNVRTYLARIDSIESIKKKELLADKSNLIPPDATLDTVGIIDQPLNEQVKESEQSSGSYAESNFSQSPLLKIILASTAIIIIGAVAYYVYNNKPQKQQFTITEHAVTAFQNQIDNSTHTQSRKTGIIPPLLKENQNKKDPEQQDASIAKASNDKPLIDIVEKNDKREAPQDNDANVFTTSFSAQDEEDFLKLVNDENSRPVGFQHEETGHTGDESEHTQTLEMSQFQVKKIGRYVIEKEIGRGAAGRVYKAWDPKLDRTVVIKTVSYSLTATAEEIKRLKARVYREARAAAKLSHPNIVIVYDVEDESSFSYIVMEYIQGTDLRILLDNHKELEPAKAVSLILQTCKALQFAHNSGVVHRDIKPSNIMIVEKDVVKVTDFGIAKITNNLTLTQTGRVVGTPSYMAPEQIEGKEVDGRADVFSLGIVLYELLTGQRPFTGDTLASLAYKLVHIDPPLPSTVNKKIPTIFDDIIRKSICKNPTDRYQSADEFYNALVKVKASSVS
ncbi:MAG: protein kinase [Deferribacteres bacterium]|nr:protein kinase [candidate division KSB1 bacterium]MCB9502799.1 protein kinase [Deferribacteres bacterium]